MTPSDLIRESTSVFIAATAAILLNHMLTGRISMAGLLYEKMPDGALAYSPSRVQLLVATLLVVVEYFSRLDSNTSELPDVNTISMVGLGGSQMLYLACKAWSAYQARKA